jgi:outer membrane protein OmpA-like peptidoglycan-associated protein
MLDDELRAGCLSLALAGSILLGLAPPAAAQASAPASRIEGIRTIEVNESRGQILSFRPGTTVVEMRGTKIEPGARTTLKVESRPGFLEIDINRGEIQGLQPARRFGRDFLTYVLWAVSVDGEPQNLGEITFDETGPISINVTTPYQTFWLMVTAEPDFAVNDPSPVVVMYSINQDTTLTDNRAIPVPGKLLYHTYYTKYDTSPAEVIRGIPNELLQARKALELAAASGVLAVPTPAGEEPLPDEARTRQTLEQARQYLQQAEAAFKAGNRAEAVGFARTASQVAENARALALGAAGGLFARQLERELTKARGEADRLREELARARSAGEEAAARRAACERELESLRAGVQQLKGLLETERAAHAATQQKLTALQQQLALLQQQISALQQQVATLQQQLQQAQAENARLRDEREKICGDLRRQLNALGQLTEQGGNLMLTLASDILFDLGSYELQPVARENLARLSTLRQLLFPQANVRYEGHTDRVGEDEYNQWLSEQRALAVYRYFLEEAMQQAPDPAAREAARDRLNAVQQLLAMPYAASRRGNQRGELLQLLGDVIIGMGERTPVEDVPGPSERNRRVVLLFPPAQTGQASSLCDAPRQ